MANALLSAHISSINILFLRKMEKALCVWLKNEGEVVLGLNKMYKDKEEMQSKSTPFCTKSSVFIYYVFCILSSPKPTFTARS